MSAPGYLELAWRLLRVRWRLRKHGFAALAEPSLSAAVGADWRYGPLVDGRLRRLARRIPGSTCLHRALALIDAAAARGLQARLVLGAQRSGGQSRAHAWVQMGTQVLGETQREGVPYRAFPPPTTEA